MTNNAKVGGVLTLVSGGIGLLWMLMLILASVFMAVLPGFLDKSGLGGYRSEDEMVFFIMAITYGVMGLAGILVGVVAIVGGVFALKRKYWGWALAGAICGALVFFPCGIPALVFIAMGKPEFQSSGAPSAPAAPAPTIVG